ncbi:glutamine synthetase family protein [Mesorhizobium australicum]|uniref:Glutamine synthetase n=1 Tax=Mesorhizobium australicum TaxID=536018 RepID=A0A1X7NHW6_9HYPH|nr:glutamine synthetase family protein [Mesorhizobium australicum]SMH36964.1 glutamine synthetase [Mesorhizobium australicum]
MTATHLAAIVTTDLTAITRGRFLPADRIGHAVNSGVGWVPANASLKPTGEIVADNIWGSAGDLRILPDLSARAVTAMTGSPTPFDMTPGDIVTLDGAPWSACSRSALRAAIAALKEETGLSVLSSFEQEFQLVGSDLPDAHVFSFQALRRAEPFAGRYFAALADAGVDPEVIIAEYGKDQYEITSGPTDALAAADRAVVIREITREMARNEGWRATFAPKTQPDAVGNGVHIHFSLIDAQGNPAGFDASKPGRLSDVAASFCAGILNHMPAMLALTASSPSSYLRLKPHNWSSAWTWLGERDREASLRICPTVEIAGKDPARQFNVEYRAADGTANPYLALAALLRAGLDGIRQQLEPAPIFSGDPELLSDGERARLGLARLPVTLDAALDSLEASQVVAEWFAPELLASFLGIKRSEAKDAHTLNDRQVCAACAALY